MTQIIAIGYCDDAGAAGAADRSRSLASELAFGADAVATVVRHRCGTCDACTSYHPDGGGEQWGPFLAGLIASALLGGGTTGRSRATPDSGAPGVDVTFLGQVHDMLEPGTSVLLVAVPDGGFDGAVQGLGSLGGTVLTSPVCAEVDNVAEVRDAGGLTAPNVATSAFGPPQITTAST